MFWDSVFVDGIAADECDKSSGVNVPLVVAFATAVISVGAMNGISSTSAHIFRAWPAMGNFGRQSVESRFPRRVEEFATAS